MGAGEQNSQLTTPTGGLESGTSDLLVETKAQWKDDLKRTDLNYDFDTVVSFVHDCRFYFSSVCLEFFPAPTLKID